MIKRRLIEESRKDKYSCALRTTTDFVFCRSLYLKNELSEKRFCQNISRLVAWTDVWKDVWYIVTDKELSQKAKDYFVQIRKTDRLIQRLTNTVNTLRAGLTSQSYELKPDKVQISGPQDRISETYARIDELERKINDRIDELIQLKAEALQRLEKLSDLDQQNVLDARYIEGNKWEKISADLDFSIAQVYRIHGAALLNFAGKNPDILKDDSKW